jgi:hypothetical protein
MNRMTFAILSMVILFAATKPSEAADLTSTFGLEEAFIDAVGNCGPSSTTAGALGKTSDPAVQIALRNAEIIEAADGRRGPGIFQTTSRLHAKVSQRAWVQQIPDDGAARMCEARLAVAVHELGPMCARSRKDGLRAGPKGYFILSRFETLSSLALPRVRIQESSFEEEPR